MPLLECVDLRKSYPLNGKPIQVVGGISLSIDPSEIVVLLGKSGCGKSTLLRIMAGLSKPDSGSVMLNGRPLNRPTPLLSIVFQNYTVFPWMTVLGNVVAGLHTQRLGRREKRKIASEYLELVGLAEFAKARPGTLSGGMQQRVALARTYAMNPQVLLMDEPFGALDAMTRREMQQELLKINSEKEKAVAFVTHDIDEAVLLGTRILVLSFRPATVAGEFRKRDFSDIASLRQEVAACLDRVFGALPIATTVSPTSTESKPAHGETR